MLCQCQTYAFVNGQHTRSSKHLKMWITSVQESWSRGKKADLGENRSGDQVDKVGTIFAFNCHIDETGDCQMMWCDWWKGNYSLSVQLEFGGWKKWQYDGHSTQNYAPYLGIVWTPPHYKDVLKGPFAIELAIHSMFTWPHFLHWNEFS